MLILNVTLQSCQIPASSPLPFPALTLDPGPCRQGSWGGTWCAAQVAKIKASKKTT